MKNYKVSPQSLQEDRSSSPATRLLCWSEIPRNSKEENTAYEEDKKKDLLKTFLLATMQPEPQNDGSTCFPGLEIRALLK